MQLRGEVMGKYENGVDTQRVILAAAKKLFLEKGYDATTYDDICREAHVNRSSVYYHFRSKENIRTSIRRGFFARAREIAETVTDNDAFVYILSVAIIQHYAVSDPSFGRFYREAVDVFHMDASEQCHERNQRLSCFLPYLTEESKAAIDQSEPTERILDYLELSVAASFFDKEPNAAVKETAAGLIRLFGKMYDIPHDIIPMVCEEVEKRLEAIPFDSLGEF